MITVITPVYNGEKFIEKCIQVVINQNCPDVEHIIVDGASKDRTVEIIKQYAEKYPHIRWVSEKDQGQSDAMNKGIAMAKGEILAILNVDDYYEPNILNKVAEILINLPKPSLLVGNCNIWDGEGNLLSINKPSKLKLQDLLMGWKINQMPANPSAYFYHKNIHEIIGLYNTSENYAMDLDFILKAVQVANIKYIDETWGNFRLHENTKTYNSIQSGNTMTDMHRIMRLYRKNLPLLSRLFTAIKYEFYYHIYDKLRFYFENPQKILPFFKSKFIGIFNFLSA
ncbi:glycosyltransferase family 2 protein [Calothrix sp. 336/3]|uniref:glycosyltransferase family 2 protein n=1 Tax=Calothrix sp. 336/3 TaxID=1337936 RepID=UPI0004E3CB70|nr:glycosyltransferase family 2 protein [Calothrix sp. 336/3]AKG20953.1 glycosyl transferase family 2 [Calothrix sp. 336/3]